MSASTKEVRRYRFAPRDRAGWILGLGAAQCVVVGSAFLLAGLLVSTTHSLWQAGVPLGGALVFAFGRWANRPFHEWLPVMAGWVSLHLHGQRRWYAALPLLGQPAPRAELPPFLDGLSVLEVPAPWLRRGHLGGVAVVRDAHTQCLSAVVRVAGREFALLERPEQERLLDAWGGALSAFCRERGRIARVSWCEWAAPAGLDEHLGYLREHGALDVETEPVASYRELLDTAGPMTTRHQALVTVTLDRRRAPAPRQPGVDATAGAAELLLEEVRLLIARLEQAGLLVDAPLSPGELAHVLRVRADPSAASRLAARGQSLGELGARVSTYNWAPLAVEVAWDHLRLDSAWHRSYWIAEWPRLEVTSEWIAPLVLHAAGIRSIAVVYEPVPPSRAQRAVDRDATRLASDEDQRSRRGFRIRARDRRAQTEVDAREAELVAGYAELVYAGFVTVTAADRDALERECAEYEQVAAQCGLELRPLHGQHDTGLGATLPLGRYPAMRRTW